MHNITDEQICTKLLSSCRALPFPLVSNGEISIIYSVQVKSFFQLGTLCTIYTYIPDVVGDGDVTEVGCDGIREGDCDAVVGGIETVDSYTVFKSNLFSS